MTEREDNPVNVYDPNELVLFIDAVSEIQHPNGYARLYRIAVNEGTRVKIDKRYYLRRRDLDRYKEEIRL